MDIICYLCDEPLTDKNTSEEHILLNSIGGRLKSPALLCSECNSKFGKEADAALSNQLALFTNLLQIKREKNSSPRITGLKSKSGTEYHIVDGKHILAKPEVMVKKSLGRIDYSISARNEEEMTLLLNNFKKKHPELDVEEALKIAKREEYYHNEPVSHSVTVGGELAFKSITKTAVNYYILCRKETDQVRHLFEYLKGNEHLEIAYHWYPEIHPHQKDKKEVVHTVSLFGDSDTKTLHCYVNFFSCFSYLVKLSENYTGESFTETYMYDVVNNIQLIKKVNLGYSLSINKFDTSTDYKDSIVKNILHLQSIISQKQTDKEISRIVDTSIRESFGSNLEQKVSAETLEDFLEIVIAKYVKFAHRNIENTR